MIRSNFTPNSISTTNLTKTLVSCFFSVILVTSVAGDPSKDANNLKIAAWNVEHLNGANDVGCIPRQDSDYAYIAGRIADLDADVVAFQEVESEKAARRIFPKKFWNVVMSDRPNTTGDQGPICWGMEDKRLRHIATGFAVKRGISFEKNESFSDLSAGDEFQRWGTDISVNHGDQSVRLLSVHLASGCWGAEQDRDASRQKICTTLDVQFDQLVKWVGSRNAANESFVVLGDFNRRLALDGDWAATRLMATELQTRLVTKALRDGVAKAAWCDERYADLIDHIVVSESIAELVDFGTLKEHSRQRPSPDHCIISVELMASAPPK